jgi:arylsulfatase A-like enzyme
LLGHWSYCFPAVLAGGGIRGGGLYGRSDRDAGYPVDNPVSPEDLAATIFAALGIDPSRTMTDRQGRPVPIAEGGRPLRELFG